MRDAPEAPRLRGGTLFSGIGAPEQAAPFVDWRWSADIDDFANAVRAHHWPHVPNLGDVAAIDGGSVEPVDVIVFGSPCQSFSVAGKRLGLEDPRGNMALIALRLVARIRPRWFVLENVAGLLSSDRGDDFKALCRVASECGYHLAFRVLDAQNFGVPQRRRRVFIVGYLGDWRYPAAVLFEPDSLRGNPPSRRKTGQGVAASASDGSDGGCGGGSGLGRWCDDWPPRRGGLPAHHGQRLDFETETFVTHTLRGEGFDASEDGTGRGTPLVPIAIQERATAENPASGPDGAGWRQDGAAYTLEARTVPQAVAFDLRGREGGAMPEGPHDTASIRAASGGSSRSYIAHPWAVRRITPREAERLQGMADDFTLIPWRGGLAPDGRRYKAVGNSMAVPVMRWILERLAAVDAEVRQ